MVVAAISPIPEFTFIDLEIQRSAPSFTVDTMRGLVEIAPGTNRSYFLILAQDVLPTIHLWKELDALLELAPPLVGLRSGEEVKVSKEVKRSTAALLKEGMTPMPILEISSTEIRKRLVQGLFCGHLLPGKTYEYIAQHKLYR
jgi:nicotinate-nucleotide adenylyltransferase